jgi:hypothetical protein
MDGAVYHQTKGVFLPGILHDEEIKTAPRFDITGKSQHELESELSPSRESGGDLYTHQVVLGDNAIHVLVWEKGERPAVWLTEEASPIKSTWSNEENNVEEMETICHGFFRIGIDTSCVQVFPWNQYQRLTHVSTKWCQGLSAAARSAGS